MSPDPDTLVDRIYEASLVPELWRAAIDAVCAVSASVSGSIICMSERDRTARGDRLRVQPRKLFDNP